MSDLLKTETSANDSGPLRKRIKVELNDSVKEDPTASSLYPVSNPLSNTLSNPVSNPLSNPLSNPVANETGMVNIPDSVQGLLGDKYPISMINMIPNTSAVKSREARLEQNRKAARESRRRKKKMVEELQRSVIFFSRINHILKERHDYLSRMLVQAQNFVQMSMQQQQQQQVQNQQIGTGTSSNQSQSTQQQNNNASTEQSQTALETSQASNESVVIKKEEAHDSSFPSTSVPQEGSTNQPQTEETLQVLQGQDQSASQQSTIQEQQAVAGDHTAVTQAYPQLASMLSNAQTPGAAPGDASVYNSNTTAFQAAATNFQAAMATNPNLALGYPAAFSGGAAYADAFQSAFLQQQAAASAQTPNFTSLGIPTAGFSGPFQHPALTQHFSQNMRGFPLSNSSAAAGLYPMSAQVQQQTTDRAD